MKLLKDAELKSKTVIVRCDFDVSLNPDFSIADDVRVRTNIPTLKLLLENDCKIICIAKLGRPKGRDPKLSLKYILDDVKKYLPNISIDVVDDFLTDDSKLKNQKNGEILILENIRYYPGEEKNDPEFAKKLASLGEVFVNDAFAVSHRAEASVVGIAKYLPSYAGISLEREVAMIQKAISNPQHPFIAILSGAKISTKIGLIGKLTEIADFILIGGGIANTFIKAEGHGIGKSLSEEGELQHAQKLMRDANEKNTKLVIPVDVVVASEDVKMPQVKKINEVNADESIYDIGPETMAIYGAHIASARTIIWNGPMGLIEDKRFQEGTDFTYYSITQNTNCISVVGGGDTLNAIKNKDYLEKITHISTGGGAMLELIEYGTLPGIEALENNNI